MRRSKGKHRLAYQWVEISREWNLKDIYKKRLTDPCKRKGLKFTTIKVVACSWMWERNFKYSTTDDRVTIRAGSPEVSIGKV